ncbi:hypothetical protein SNE40_020782 [Patella caerulea]|uniref:Uncharacterized protein n=1 Tax=Patella caerulea TaxID=87958 RepID=A0AAN8P7P9_PATCE
MEYHRNQIQEADSKGLLKICEKLIGQKGTVNNIFPSTATSEHAAAEMLSDFFIEKIDKLCEKFDPNTSSELQKANCHSRLEIFEPASLEEVRKLILAVNWIKCLHNW